jgi:hypothetical protein
MKSHPLRSANREGCSGGGRVCESGFWKGLVSFLFEKLPEVVADLLGDFPS